MVVKIIFKGEVGVWCSEISYKCVIHCFKNIYDN